jgi:hypothetical protein
VNRPLGRRCDAKAAKLLKVSAYRALDYHRPTKRPIHLCLAGSLLNVSRHALSMLANGRTAPTQRNGFCYLCIAETAMLACVLLEPPAFYASV